MIHQKQPHDYVKPPAGTTARGDAVCSKCGAKRSTAGDSECYGSEPATTVSPHDYDPLA